MYFSTPRCQRAKVNASSSARSTDSFTIRFTPAFLASSTTLRSTSTVLDSRKTVSTSFRAGRTVSGRS
jgi:hypothetical protein